MAETTLRPKESLDMRKPRVLSFGIVVADVVCPVLDGLPAEGHLVQVDDIELHCGGCAANVAIGLARLGVDATLVGKVGDDLFGKAVVQYMEARGVRTSAVSVAEDYGTSKTVILPVRGQDRRFIHCFGANAAVSAQSLKDALDQPFDFIYVGGYLAMPAIDPSQIAAILHDARSGGAKVVLDVVLPHANPNVAELRSALEPVLVETDVFVPNEDEAAVITGSAELRSQADFLLGMGASEVIVTRGAEGSYYRSASEEWFEPPVVVEYVDGSGAGDAFSAGLVFGMVESLTTKRAVKLASAYGASACRGIGCTGSLMSRQEMAELLKV
jgi:sugar/nucleoside kinase (ribokinase family)